MTDFEKLGLFYLGRPYDLATGRTADQPLLYDSRDLTTHAVCVGMTGSGKTGLCLSLLEEAAIDGVPTIAIDPKGDLGNLLLTFPELEPRRFQEWIDPAEAARENISVEELARQTAEKWRSGLQEWGQDGERIRRFREAVDLAIYTPGSDAGVPLSVLRSFAAPSPEGRGDGEALRERIAACVSGLLALVEVEADPLQSREHILLSKLLDEAWSQGRDLDMETLIRQLQQPAFEKIGVMDLESFFPAQARFQLAMRLNNLLASPGFAAWTSGEPLDVARLLHTKEGKPRISILSIAHLSDAQRMFFVTLLLGEIIAWMRRQSGSNSLRALVYMDEVFGFFPPTANPPAKTPMLTLLKQARAYGLGIILATQNPVDLDYKGLSNAGTWFLGRLQTERDKARVLEGLEGVSAAAGYKFDRAALDATLSGLKKRVFLMNNVHEDAPVVFETRWALSYLRGPITLEQIRKLSADQKAKPSPTPPAAAAAETAAANTAPAATAPPAPATVNGEPRPVLPPGIDERFLRPAAGQAGPLVYSPGLLATAKVHFLHGPTATDTTLDVWLLAPADDSLDSAWESCEESSGEPPATDSAAREPCSFLRLPPLLARPKSYSQLATQLKDHLYRSYRLTLWKCPLTKLVSRAGEAEGEFRIRRELALREARDAEIERLTVRHARSLASLEEKVRKARERVDRESAQASQSTWDAMVTAGTSILGGLFGRKKISVTQMTRVGTAARAAGRAAKQRGDITVAEAALEKAEEQLAEKRGEIEAAIHEIQSKYDPAVTPLVEYPLRPRKSDIDVTRVSLAWQPVA